MNDRNIERERLEQAVKVREELEARLRRLEAQLDLLERRVTSEGRGSGKQDRYDTT